MDAGLKSLLKPEVLNTMNGLELVARIIVEGFMSGSNKSQAIGIGQEFSQYRSYEPGDDLRQLDWKMYARSERYFIKQSEIETNITVKFMLDASKSMQYEEDHLSKLQFAKVMTAALGYLARKQGDTFGLYAVNENHVHAVHPKFEQQQFMRFLHELVLLKAEGGWKKGGLEQLFDHHGKELLVFITDLYDERDDLFEFIFRLKTTRNEVVVLHLMGGHEMALDQEGAYTFKDLESGQIVKVDTESQRSSYTQAVGNWIESTKDRLLEGGVAYETVILNDDPGATLRTFLKNRKRLLG